MVKLYIDFDGVIKNTIMYMYQEMNQLGIDYKNENSQPEIKKYVQSINWIKMLRQTDFINDSISAIKKLKEANLYDIKILTHVNSNSESVEKKRYLKKMLPGIEVITVPKEIEKAFYVNAEGAILVDDWKGNLKTWKQYNGIPIHFDEERNESEYHVISTLLEIFDLTEEYARKVKRKNK